MSQLINLTRGKQSRNPVAMGEFCRIHDGVANSDVGAALQRVRVEIEERQFECIVGCVLDRDFLLCAFLEPSLKH